MSSDDIFKKVARLLPHFEVREGQRKMFEDVSIAFHNDQTFLIEAGTGIGKSLAYLIPALLWAVEKKETIVVATHTIALQEQLIQKDLPLLLKALDVEIKVALVKGMNNYICLRKIHDSKESLPEALLQWTGSAQEGSRSELPLSCSAELWEDIGADADSCTYNKCPYNKECFFFKARKEMASARLLVVNHHLLCADLAIREERDNFEESALLPPYKRLIIDEAHHCEEVATHYFAQKVSRRGFVHHLGRLVSDRGTGKLATLYRKICEVYPEGAQLSEDLTLILPAEKRTILHLMNEAFESLSHYFSTHKGEDKLRIKNDNLNDGEWIEDVQPKIALFAKEGRQFVHSVLSIQHRLKEMQDPLLDLKCEGIRAEIVTLCNRLNTLIEILIHFIFDPLETSKVRWIEGIPPDLHLISADLDCAPRLAKNLFERCPTIVLCSATLSTQGQFSYIRKRLGIQQAEERIYPSPFNYEKQVFFTVPTSLPDPGDPHFLKEAVETIKQTAELTRGGVFVLFTSHTMLRECERLLSHHFYKNKYSLHCQGSDSRTSLLNKFKTIERSVLFGTDSFWEGVDVAGEALRCVIIAKLPFKAPNDPLFEARSEAITAQGGSPFFDLSLPQAIVKFKQGFGRLIRSKEDRGSVICLDKRLVKKGYGKKILQSLPSCPLIAEATPSILEKLQAFFR